MTTEEKVDRIKLMKDLDNKQEIVNQLYAEEGLTDRVLDLQLEINESRAKENIPDPEEMVYKNFAQ